ncbi:uncharacterized protein LOC8260302 [Ricinus communis]|uniref:uncharacterized protein LOC8260302 n=1 Tax=Ricinus communis TaxID=3988 RepID=UPI00201AFC55|nr:uncharacterized protein LOC8260302 [Ricinus communis]
MASPASVKIALISTCVLSVAVLLKLSVPWLTYFAASELPVMYSFLLSWLRPPYLYLVINGIIISILASSKLQPQEAKEPLKQTDVVLPPTTVIVAAKSSDGSVLPDYIDDDAVAGGCLYQDCPVSKVSEKETKESDGGDRDAGVSPKSVQPPPQRSDSMEFLFEKLAQEKPRISARFGHKKSVKASPEAGKATVLGVSKSKRNDTLESTWKMITDGRAMPLTRHLKKSDTWDSHLRRDPPIRSQKMNKSETFTESKSKLSQSRQGSGKLKKEPSLSQDELNKRVEAFINKFNEQMRLQRQESLNQYQEMINRGAY